MYVVQIFTASSRKLLYFYFSASSTGHLYLSFQDAIIISKTRCLLELNSFFELEFVVINSVIQNEGTTLSHYYGISYQPIIYHIYIYIIYRSIYCILFYLYISIIYIYLSFTIYYLSRSIYIYYISSNQRVARSIA